MQKENRKQDQKERSSKSKPANNGNSKKKAMQSYARYSGMAIQLGVTIAIGAFIGQKLDEWFGLDKPLLTALCALLATIGAIYVLIKAIQ